MLILGTEYQITRTTSWGHRYLIEGDTALVT